MAFYTDIELKEIGFKLIGENVKISKLSSIYGANNIEIGSNTRIDDFCVISAGDGGIVIGDYVHIACYSLLVGKAKIEMKNFSGLSSRVSIYSSSDDYSGKFLTNPTVPSEFTNVKHSSVTICEHVIIGTNSTVLPGVTINIGAAIGAYTLVNKNIDASKIAVGVPAKILNDRDVAVFELEKQLMCK